MKKFDKNGARPFNDNLEHEDVENLYTIRFNFLKGACENEFSDSQFKIIYNLVMQAVPAPVSSLGLDIDQYDYILRKYDELNLLDINKRIKNRFAYFRKLMKLSVD